MTTRPYGTTNDADVVSRVLSAHSCRAWGDWCEGRYKGDPARALREVNRGLCGTCYIEAMAAWQAGAEQPMAGLGTRRRAARAAAAVQR